MSIEIVLVPLAIAAVTAWRTSRLEEDATGRTICAVTTRMKDVGLLKEALGDTGAQVTETDGTLLARWSGVEMTMQRDADGIWGARLTGEVDQARAEEIVEQLDRAYGLRVQQEVVRRLKERAPGSGLRLESETVGEDAAITLTLSVQAGAS